MASSIKATLARNVKTLRIARNLTQEKLAEKLGMSISFVAMLETEKRSVSIESLEALSTALGVEPYQLLVSPEKALTVDPDFWLPALSKDFVEELSSTVEKFTEKFRKKHGR